MGAGRGKVVSGAKSSGVLRGAQCWLRGCAAVVVLPFYSLLAEALSAARASRAARGLLSPQPCLQPGSQAAPACSPVTACGDGAPWLGTDLPQDQGSPPCPPKHSSAVPSLCLRGAAAAGGQSRCVLLGFLQTPRQENFGRVCLRASHRLSILCQLDGCVFLVPLRPPVRVPRVPPDLCPLFPSFTCFSPSPLSGALLNHRTGKDRSAMSRTLASYCDCVLAKLTRPLFMPLVKT